METGRLLKRRRKRLSPNYDNYKTSGIMRQDGKQTLGENIADLGAMHCLSRIVEKRDCLRKNFLKAMQMRGPVPQMTFLPLSFLEWMSMQQTKYE